MERAQAVRAQVVRAQAVRVQAVGAQVERVQADGAQVAKEQVARVRVERACTVARGVAARARALGKATAAHEVTEGHDQPIQERHECSSTAQTTIFRYVLVCILTESKSSGKLRSVVIGQLPVVLRGCQRETSGVNRFDPTVTANPFVLCTSTWKITELLPTYPWPKKLVVDSPSQPPFFMVAAVCPSPSC